MQRAPAFLQVPHQRLARRLLQGGLHRGAHDQVAPHAVALDGGDPAGLIGGRIQEIIARIARRVADDGGGVGAGLVGFSLRDRAGFHHRVQHHIRTRLRLGQIAPR